MQETYFSRKLKPILILILAVVICSRCETESSPDRYLKKSSFSSFEILEPFKVEAKSYLLTNAINFNKMSHNTESRVSSSNTFPLIAKQNTLDSVDFDYIVLTEPFLSSYVDDVFENWYRNPYYDSIHFDLFCEYLLAYRATENETSENWLKIYKNDFLDRVSLDTCESVNDVCDAINNSLAKDFQFTANIDSSLDGYRPTVLSEVLIGSCNEMSSLATFYLRSMGFPATNEYTQQWGNMNTGHRWNAVLNSKGEMDDFMGIEKGPSLFAVDELENKGAKIFRFSLSKNVESLAYLAESLNLSNDLLPSYLQGMHFKDVTSDRVPVGTVRLNVDDQYFDEKKLVFLAVFDGSAWNSIDWAMIKNNQAIFDNIGLDIVYLPIFFKNSKYYAGEFPILLDSTGKERFLKPDLVDKAATLNRIKPLKRFYFTFEQEKKVLGGIFEASLDINFEDKDTIYHIVDHDKTFEELSASVRKDQLPHDYYIEVDVTSTEKYKYLRFSMPNHNDKIFTFNDIEFLDERGNIITGKAFGPSPSANLAFDGRLGENYIQKTDKENWVGLEFDRETRITKVRYWPISDSYRISKNTKYSLSYWSKKWVHFGTFTPTQNKIELSSYHKDGLYQLTNMDSEEKGRVFLIENGKQVWY